MYAEIGRIALEEVGYDAIMRTAEGAGWVKRVRPNAANALGQQVRSAGFWIILAEYAALAGMASQADGPAPGPGDLVGLGMLVVGLVDAGFGDHMLVSIPRRARGDVAVAAPPAAGMPAAVTAPPSVSAPVMPADLSEADQALWRTCNQQHNTYKASDKEGSRYGRQMGPLAVLLNNNKASEQQILDYCSLLTERLKILKREHKERSKYIEMDCDRFDWFGDGSTKAQRLAKHQDELSHVDTEITNLYAAETRFCK